MKKSGKFKKSGSKVKFPQKWPHAYLRYEYTLNDNLSFDDLPIELLIAGELRIIQNCTSKKERKGRLRLLEKVSYWNYRNSATQAKSLYRATVSQIEQGLAHWNSDFYELETNILVSRGNCSDVVESPVCSSEEKSEENSSEERDN